MGPRLTTGATTVLRYILFVVLFGAVVSLSSGPAAAEKVLGNVGGWEIYTDGRAAGFLSYAYGDGYPQPQYGHDLNGNARTTPVDTPQEGGGFKARQRPAPRWIPHNGGRILNQGTINMTRVRSGFVSNTFGFGARGHLTESTALTAYIQIWAFVENNGRQKNLPNIPDARQGYLKMDGPWGSLTVGRMRALFSRGNTDIDALYAHRWGLGWPGKHRQQRAHAGQLGFGVLGVGFSSGVIYGTPSFGGLQLNIGLFDPIQLQGMGGWTRTKYARPEAELTFERSFGKGGWGKLVLFANGAYQKVYKDCVLLAGLRSRSETRNLPCDQTIEGVAGGGRLELGPVHIGVSGHVGYGLGLNYALEVSEAAQDRGGNLRKISGLYLQTQVVLRKFDLFAGAGIAQVYLTDYDNAKTLPIRGTPAAPAPTRWSRPRPPGSTSTACSRTRSASTEASSTTRRRTFISMSMCSGPRRIGSRSTASRGRSRSSGSATPD